MIRIVDAVKQIREMDPGIGYYKLWLMMKRMFLCDWVPGRDAFLMLLRDFQLMQKRPKPRHTTNSNHRYHKYKNLIPRLRADACEPAMGERHYVHRPCG